MMIKRRIFRRFKHAASMKKKTNIEKLSQKTRGVTKCLGNIPGDNIKVNLKDVVLNDEY